MAVLHRGQGKNDGGVDGEPRAYHGLSGGRRRVRGKNPVALHREYRRYRPDLPRDVQKQSLSGPLAFGVVGSHPTRASDGTSQYRPGDAGRNTERRAGDRARLGDARGGEAVGTGLNADPPFGEVAATNRRGEMVEEGQFGDDLFYRLSVFLMRLPFFSTPHLSGN